MIVTELTLPILMAAIAVWFASFVAWAISPHHRKDSRPLEKETDAALRQLIKENGVRPGQYMYPFMYDRECAKDEAAIAAVKEGQFGVLTVIAPPNMARNMVLSMAVYLIVSLFVGYLASLSGLSHGAEFLDVFRVTGTAGVLAYTFAFLPNNIWFGQTTRSMLMNMMDGMVFGLITGVMFASLWPAVT